MAETELYTTTINNHRPNPTKLYTQFLYKAIFASILVLILPLIFPSQAPDFINHKLNTTSWELLQLLLVGIAVSYGLFSKRNNEAANDKDKDAHSYVTGLLQVSSSVFDDDENPSGSPLQAQARGSNSNRNSRSSKVVDQTWNSQYYRGEPIVVVAKDSSSLLLHDDDDDDATTTSIEKPRLFLPVGSLKNESCCSKKVPFSRSNSSTRFSREEPKAEENIVLRSPIPWRSRSGGGGGGKRMKELQHDFHQTQLPASNSFRHHQSSSKPLISSPSSSSQIQSKSLEQEEDVGSRKKITHKSSSFSPIPPPPPPPPPPPHWRPVNLIYSHNKMNTYSTGGMEFRRNTRNEISEDLQQQQQHNRMMERRGTELRRFRSTPKETHQLELEEYNNNNNKLSHDKKIQSFIETTRRGSSQTNKRFFMDQQNTTPTTPASAPAPAIIDKRQDSDESSSSSSDGDGDEDEDDELEELASKNNGEMMGLGGGINNNNNNDNAGGGPDVDKKADEFIAKFREQIRLQRIASIRRTSTNGATQVIT